ncbi:GntR family transcriptional regulator [Tepidamorphus sp. 3E244]|uniref:GntR family transcriptional regulator n=1 Tax=Tepidamorphus sp. 3E244 TaxID=3385498 RepID=UPI0038FD1D23
MSMAGVALKPIGTSFMLKDHIYEVLLEAILSANIYEEDADLRLDERTMAEQLGISRTPVREALARLERDGFVEIQPRKGVFICRKSLDEVLEMVVAWAALESMAARLATQNATDAELKKLRKMAMRDSESAARADIEEYSEANFQFHQTILEVSHCGLLKKMADGLFMHMHAIRRRAMGEGDRVGRSVIDHMEIIEALESRDPDLAERLVREHTMRLHDHIRRTWKKIAVMSRTRRAAS